MFFTDLSNEDDTHCVPFAPVLVLPGSLSITASVVDKRGTYKDAATLSKEFVGITGFFLNNFNAMVP